MVIIIIINNLLSEPLAMYICSCRALTDRDVGNAIQGGADRPSAVYKSCGCKPDCGRCVAKIVNMLREHNQEVTQAPA
ncbi:(2Fe-2S)-binding protein [Commensalibacter oyaizuii]|uniref:Bacterioferritin-associated ferredoxin n=1 Tax=Commensalibacter oyaizuii TaxID=3043873 RepID=A0ABT6PY82_9PROT|nr:(2Fe-2S)-binding protein [Commensalibacter sp. TBRC 16381]MDI2089824.1 (2Fe-2S)-binding protein [Commensalibacter sp. TBRC 16381]